MKHCSDRFPIEKDKFLFFDSHFSHINLEKIELVKSQNIHLVLLPPHTTHILQLLDVGVIEIT